VTRWATFDCYGTLIDWNAGISAELARAFGLDVERDAGEEADAEQADEGGSAAAAEDEAPSEDELRLRELLERYHVLEAEVERDGSRSYREVMTEVMRRLGAPEDEAGGLAESLPRWPPFPEVPPALAEVRERGWKLGILSNSDPDLIAASVRLLGVEVDEIVVASEVRAYKPSLRLWTEFYARTLADKRRHVHVGASIYHDIAPAVRLRLPSVWINRLDEHPGPSPTIELTDLEGLPDALDSIIPTD
jgi:2-haloacid dehalogenase